MTPPSRFKWSNGVSNRALPIVLALLTNLPLSAQGRDLYPQVRALLLEAEAASTKIQFLDDRSNPHTSIGTLYAHAGYLEDAERAFARTQSPTPDPPYDLWRGWVVYGRLDRAEKSIDAITDPENRARFLLSLADLLWRTGQSDQARLKFVQAKELATKVADQAHTKQLVSAIDQGLQFVSDPPPDLVTTIPHPRPRFNVQNSPIPLFPITADGFKDTDSTSSAARANINADFIEKLYDRVAAHDPDGLRRLTESASTPFQKALGLASLEHLMILSGKPELAEEFATAIPETDSSSLLAKAEALSAAGAARLRNHGTDAALSDFTAAIKVVQSVHDLPLGEISVLVSVATAQFKGGLIEDGTVTFRAAIGLAQSLPQRPKPQPGLPRRTVLGTHYKDEGFKQILTAAIAQRDRPVVNEVIGAWNKTGDDADGAAVEGWLDADVPDEAIAMAHKIENAQARVSALLEIARTLLDRAGAPIF
jgi:tetratricopeptide (TPR) repeat protein